MSHRERQLASSCRGVRGLDEELHGIRELWRSLAPSPTHSRSVTSPRRVFPLESCRPPRLETPPTLRATSSHAAPSSAENTFPKVHPEAPKLQSCGRCPLPYHLPLPRGAGIHHLPTSPPSTPRLLLGPLWASPDQPGSRHPSWTWVPPAFGHPGSLHRVPPPSLREPGASRARHGPG